ncbi:Serine-threonine/tyrosine-protein kinase, catalytic domain [Sesbania bispinosa]|nr:Serine-threonine/tyrosine-protein kinase, catalytic domain [Sesbania bispinosa]
MVSVKGTSFINGIRAKDWPIKTEPCRNWTGVQCRNGRVVGINVSGLKRTRVGRLNPSFEVDSLANFTLLDSFNASGFMLNGSIPDWFGENLGALQVLDLRSCSITGMIPGSLGGLSSLKFLLLSRNSLTGRMPSTLGMLSGLSVLDLSENMLSGPVPSSLSKLGNLTRLDLSSNYLYGSIPPELGALSNLQKLNLSGNSFTALVPSQLVTFPSCGNSFGGVLPAMLWSLPSLRFVDVSSNNLTGPLPKLSSSNVNSTGAMFNLSNNLFYGHVNISLNKFEIDLSGNYLEGEVQVGGLNNVTLARNCLQKISNQRGLEECRQFYLQRNLPFDAGAQEQAQPPLQESESKSNKRVVFILRESYVVELELLSKVSHERLVPILGHCLENEREKCIVYKYMPNGDLATSLHRVSGSDGKLQSLDWITRLKIAIGAAEGLAYLHECSPPLVHRDVRASSILLDDKFEVRLGSLSEVTAQGDLHQNVISRVFSKPPSSNQGNSGRSSVTCAYDVYCFGKILLQLVTGNLDVSNSEDDTTKEWLEQTLRYISIFDKERLTKIVDPSLIVDDDLLEEVWAMAIVAKSCLNPKPSKRPPMRHVLKALENPLKIVREENFSSAKLRTTSSNRSWNTAFFGSWRHSSSESAVATAHTNRGVLVALNKQEE